MRFEFSDSAEAEIVPWGNSFFIRLLFTTYIQIWNSSLCLACGVHLWELPVQVFIKLEAFTGGNCSLLGPYKSFLNCWCLLSRGRVAFLLGLWCFLPLGSHHTQWGWQRRCGRWATFCLYADFLFSFVCYLQGPCLKLALWPYVFTEPRASFRTLQCVAGTELFSF